jgi:hypothetical protein
VSLSERTTGGRRGKENVREWKFWNNPPLYEYNIMHCTANFLILGEHGDRKWVGNGGMELIWLKHDIYKPDIPRQNSLGLLYTLKKNEGQ